MPPRLSTLMAGLLALGIQHAAIAQDDTLKLLVEQGNYWQSRGDQKRAAEAWEKLLRADPQNAAALYGMARVELAAQRTAAVQRYLADLRRAAPDSPLISQLEQEINLQRPGSNRALDEARQFAQLGEPEKAIAKYQEALGGARPKARSPLSTTRRWGTRTRAGRKAGAAWNGWCASRQTTHRCDSRSHRCCRIAKPRALTPSRSCPNSRDARTSAAPPAKAGVRP
ncbi:tetratricopeptide repeat protein [Verticiella alkaliphila]|uniref:tetratricopeptide repeat protein n=1 Tax=Verticiella alkaliphila TaxID=2779529 RepID=UPI00209B0A53|nr:tetratricopeptide repeat protein [Verticiella sp. GG226]